MCEDFDDFHNHVIEKKANPYELSANINNNPQTPLKI